MRTNRQSSVAMRPNYWLSISALALLVPLATHAGLTKETIGTHVCFVYAPATLAADKPAPLLMLFHGSGRDGMSQINEWRKLAEREGIVLAAPTATDSQAWSMMDDGPALLREIVDFVGKQHRIDTRRIYAFGHSAGAVHMLTIAPMEASYLAAVAVHAGQFSNAKVSGMLNFAQRKIPIFIVIGTKDQFFSTESVRQTREAFASEGFPIETKEIPNYDHNYYRHSIEINDMVWKFLAPKHLDADAHFTAYTITKNGERVSILPVAEP
jgi:predicted esterase